MRRGMKVVAGLLGVVLVGVALVSIVGIKVFQKPISLALIERQLEQNMGRDVIATLPKGLHVGPVRIRRAVAEPRPARTLRLRDCGREYLCD